MERESPSIPLASFMVPLHFPPSARSSSQTHANSNPGPLFETFENSNKNRGEQSGQLIPAVFFSLSLQHQHQTRTRVAHCPGSIPQDHQVRYVRVRAQADATVGNVPTVDAEALRGHGNQHEMTDGSSHFFHEERTIDAKSARRYAEVEGSTDYCTQSTYMQ